MKTANPVEKDNKSHQSKGKKQSPKDSVVIPLSEVDVARTQIQQSQRNGNIGGASGLQNIHDQGSEIMNGKFQNSLSKTGDINHPQTKEAEKDYMATTSIDQARDYNDRKSGTYLPKTAQEQAVAYQGSKTSTGVTGAGKQATAKSTSGKSNIAATEQSPLISADETVEINTEVKAPASAKDNPGFMELSGSINTTAKLQKHHESAPKASNDAQAAAPSPSNERESMAQAGQVNVMDEQKPGIFSKDEFKALLTAKIKGIKLPANEAEADEFEKNNNIQEVNKSAMGDVKNENNAASHDIADATAKKPDITGQPVRSVAKMPTPNVGKAPGIPSVAKAMPVKRDTASVEKPIQEQTASIDNEMKANGVTDSMLANSNEPSFTKALAEKNNAKTQSAAATQQFRKTEGGELAKTKEEAQSQAARHITGMHSARKGGLDHAHGEQKQTATKDSQKRKEIADHINSIYNSSKTDVDGILNNLDKSVAEKFDRGSKAAKKAFEDHIDKEMDAYKLRRYGRAGMTYGAMAALALVVWDKLTGLPAEVNKYFDSGKKLYIKVMDRYIDDIATHVTTQLNAAKTRIAKGKKDVQTYVNSLSPSLRKIGKEAITEIQKKFNALEESVNSKKDALIDTLAKKYADNVAGIDARITELKSQNSGLINKALDMLKTSVFAIIIEIKNTLTNLLSGVIEAIQAIITDPIGFFRNLIAGVSQGFTNFGANIWTHLKTGFFGWLTGAMKGISLTMPEDLFSLKGVFSITTQVLGLTWNGIRAIGARVIGEPVMKVLETGFEMVQVVRKEGVAGLWEHLKDQFADLKETVMDAIMDIIQNQVIQAGIKWVMGLLTPVGAFIKAAMAIIDVVKFFIQRAAQIMELVKAFTDSIKAIASGNVGAVAKAIENALGKAVPVLIGFLASLLGIGGLADKVVGVISKIRQRIENAIVKFWTFVKGKARGLLGKFVGKSKNDNVHEPEKQKKIDEGFVYLKGEEKKVDNNHNNKLTLEQAAVAAKKTKAKHPVFSSLRAESKDDKIIYRYTASPENVHETGTELEKANDSDIGIKVGAEISVKYSDKSRYRARILSIDQDADKITYEFIYDKLTRKAEPISFEDFDKKVKNGDINLAPGKEHNRYKPDPDTIVMGIKNGVFTLSYSYIPQVEGEIPPSFKASISMDKGRLFTHIVNGYSLSVKPSGTRGVNTAKGSNREGTHRAHLIADWFKGSGYKEALNIINTSAEYNTGSMYIAEREIESDAEKIADENPDKIITFDMTVEAKYYVLTDKATLEGFELHFEKEDVNELYKILQNNEDPRQTESVNYLANNFKADGVSIGGVPLIARADRDEWI